MDYGLVTTVFTTAADVVKEDNGWFNVSPAWLALLGTLFGGVGLKVVEAYLNKPSRRDSTPAELREELRTQIEGLKTDVNSYRTIIDNTEKEMLEWQGKYWTLVAEHSKQQRMMLDYLSELTTLREQIKEREKNGSRGQQHPDAEPV